MEKTEKKAKRELEVASVPRCKCGLKIRGKNHNEGPHHQAWTNHSTNAVRKAERDR